MSYATLCEVFANRKNLSKKEARGASSVFRGVSTTVRTIECGQRE